MHAIFMPYGKKEWVDKFLRDIMAQKCMITMTSPDGKENVSWNTEFQLRVLPFGFYEVVFPKEYLDRILTTLDFPNPSNPDTIAWRDRYKVPEWAIKQVRKLLNCKEAPTNYHYGNPLLWLRGIDMNHTDVYILPIGIREDGELTIDNKNANVTMPDGKVVNVYGWKHEAI